MAMLGVCGQGDEVEVHETITERVFWKGWVVEKMELSGRWGGFRRGLARRDATRRDATLPWHGVCAGVVEGRLGEKRVAKDASKPVSGSPRATRTSSRSKKQPLN